MNEQIEHELTTIAAKLVTTRHFSTCHEDWKFPKTMPVKYARELIKKAQKQDAFLKDVAYELTQIRKKERKYE
jgi:hypothetical protein